MSYCMAPQDIEYPCSKRNKCKNSRKYRNDIHERPVRDTPGIITEPTINHFPPPEPPGPSSDWELQYCKWSGWTWVKKSDREEFRPRVELRQPSDSPKEFSPAQQPPGEKKKKKGRLFSCFKKSTNDNRASQRTTPNAPLPRPAQPEPQPINDAVLDDFDDCCCCGMDYECCCNVCPCVTQVCCCCPCERDQGKRRESKTIETQTVKEMKEKATKISEMHLPRPRPCCVRKRKCKCRCKRPVCCPCRQKACCPCVQPLCCPCKSNQPDENSSKKKNDDSSTINSDNIVNFCLTNYLGSKKPSSSDFKSNALLKSLDLLLKNNINIMNLFNDKKDLKHEVKPIVSNQTISCLSSDNVIKRTGQEHNKLLTAVCDAILSSHKFDNDKFSSRPQFTDSRFNFKNSDSKESFNIFSSKEILGRILSDLNFSMNKSLDGPSIPKEVGISKNGPQKIDSFYYPKRSLTKLIRNKSRILTAPRFPKKIEALRKLDLLKSGRDDSRVKRGFGGHYKKVSGLKVDDPKKGKLDESKISFTDIFKNSQAVNKLNSNQKSSQMCSTSRQDTSTLESVEALLKSLDLTDDSTGANFKNHEKISNERNRLETLLQDHQLNLLDSTSPPFTDFDLLLTNDEDRQEVQDNKKPKDCSSK
ncbi:uncharacterized protein LOC123011149 [Tribolium madens]|uniref:uncharacterized protein LOC123011149 n=1 Tax=Tribolium madens TaxID=41895 RepID=UPI001CF75E2C|nr:uncharacterized protein LOC123011149 [Tribolium madens]